MPTYVDPIPAIEDVSGDGSGSAVFSGDYRYSLSRSWGEGERLLWVMLNPSTAGAKEDDPTLRRCLGFTRRESKYGALTVVNLLGLVATRPIHLAEADDPVGPSNRFFVAVNLRQVDTVVSAWGAGIEKVAQAKEERAFFMDSADQFGVKVIDLGITQAGHPRHPLYLAKTTP